MPFEGGAVLGVMITDDRAGFRLRPDPAMVGVAGPAWRVPVVRIRAGHLRHDVAGMVLDEPFRAVQLPVQVQPTVWILGPCLPDERVGEAEVDHHPAWPRR